jgi:mRNA-degrading endonuclease RelE of RelBE toxin-antitoxin system
MNPKSRYELVYASQIKLHLMAIEPKHHSLIRKTIEDELQFEPDIETINRKPLKRPIVFEASWELRFGPNNQFRVFYDIYRETRKVNIVAIGIKRGNRLWIGKEEITS